ncbi:MAG: prephenate dehydrogenase/arogenate dehydrogenase family protein [Candidatus Omnitrophica bacterium]|nr:prephenate dehydrogenase/arogenate dehydrogenase family protein [Candidatus Omnitrophota bacterium]
MKIKSIAIIGLGLMGGSLAAACRKKFPKVRIFGISRNLSALRFARKKKWIHEGFTDLKMAAADADLIIICTPVDTFAKTMILLDQAAKRGAVVTDVGSVKGLMQSWVSKKKLKKIHFVGSHPMVGSHRRGIEAARPELYDKGLVFITPEKATNRTALKVVKSFWATLCPKIVILSAPEHDRIAAQISHLPHLLAACLVETVASQSLPFAGAGFKDTTRIAQGHPSVWLPIMMANQTQVGKALQAFEKELHKFKTALIKNDHKALFLLLQHSSQTRSQISL